MDADKRNEISVHVDITELDTAIEKASRLICRKQLKKPRSLR